MGIPTAHAHSNPSGLTHFMLLSFAYTRFVRPLFGSSLIQPSAHFVTTSPTGKMYRSLAATLQRNRPERQTLRRPGPLRAAPLIPVPVRAQYGRASKNVRAHFGVVRGRRLGMAYATRLSLAAPGAGPLAGGRWHKPARLPGSPWALGLASLGPIYGGPGASPCGGLPWAALRTLGGLAGSGAWPPLPGSLTGSQWGGLGRAAWRLINVRTWGGPRPYLGRAPNGRAGPLAGSGRPLAGRPLSGLLGRHLRPLRGLGPPFAAPGAGSQWGPHFSTNNELNRPGPG